MNTSYSDLGTAPAERATDLGAPQGHQVICISWGNEPVALVDISETGARLQRSPRFEPKPGVELDAVLQLKEHFEHRIRLKVIHVQPDSFGVVFVGSTALFKNLIRTYFRHELLGATLRPHDIAGSKVAKWASRDGQEAVEVIFEGGQPSQFTVSERLSGLNAEDLIRVIRNIRKMPVEQRRAIESLLISSQKPTGSDH